MDFNSSKCYMKMSVHRKKASINVNYILYNKYPYLGDFLSSDLRWNSHVDRDC